MPFSRLIDQFDQRAQQCSCDAELRLLLDDAVRELGFDYFALLHHASLRRGGAHLIRIDTYPAGWVGELLQEELVADDPVHLASGRTNTGFSWDQLVALIPVTARHRAILEASGRYGIGLGFTVPANVPGEPSGSCSFAVRRGRELPVHRLLCAEQIGAHAFRIARGSTITPRWAPIRTSARGSGNASTCSLLGKATGRLRRS
jgi:LuxR family quorum-sensing system transcriptional regulator CciR